MPEPAVAKQSPAGRARSGAIRRRGAGSIRMGGGGDHREFVREFVLKFRNGRGLLLDPFIGPREVGPELGVVVPGLGKPVGIGFPGSGRVEGAG